MKHTLAILVENRFGELARIVGLFSARGYNIESLTVAETLEPQLSRVTLVTSGDDQTVEQIVKQLKKQIRVQSVIDLTVRAHIEREMAWRPPAIATKLTNCSACWDRTEFTKLHEQEPWLLAACRRVISAAKKLKEKWPGSNNAKKCRTQGEREGA